MARSDQPARDHQRRELDVRAPVAVRHDCRPTRRRRVRESAGPMEPTDRSLASIAGVGRLTVIVRDAASGKWRVFERPLQVIAARTIEDVLPAIGTIENACVRHHMYSAGFVSYEAAPAFDRALKTQGPDDFPLLWFGVYDTAHERTLDELGPVAAACPQSAGNPRYRQKSTLACSNTFKS